MTAPAISIETLLKLAEEEAKNPERFLKYRNDPDGFASDILGVLLWKKQMEVLYSVRDNYKTAVRSGHAVGKSFAVACLILWWLYARKALVISTAPTWNHVEQVLWREIKAVAGRSLVRLPGEHLQAGLQITPTWYAIGLSTNQPSAFQGRHHPDLLCVVDEAAGVDEQVHLEISTCASDPAGNRICMIGNPTEMSGRFYEAFNSDPTWNKLHISCMDHPNVAQRKEIIPGAVKWEWVEEKRLEWGESHPFWYSRVLGEFPKISTKGVIPLLWAERARNEEQRKLSLELAEQDRLPRIGGLDVARYGDNKCVLFIRRGDAIEAWDSWHHASLMETAGRAALAIRTWNLKSLVVDSAGLGGGVVDRLLEQGLPALAFNGGHRAFSPGSYANRRSELWWNLRQRFERKRLWIPRDCEKLISDLITPEYTLTSGGRLQVETKEILLSRGKKSPDFGDALSLVFALDEDPEAELMKQPDRYQDANALKPLDASYHDLIGGLPDGF